MNQFAETFLSIFMVIMCGAISLSLAGCAVWALVAIYRSIRRGGIVYLCMPAKEEDRNINRFAVVFNEDDAIRVCKECDYVYCEVMKP